MAFPTKKQSTKPASGAKRETDLIPVGALWQSKNNELAYNGKLDKQFDPSQIGEGFRLLAFIDMEKKGDNYPDIRLYAAPPREGGGSYGGKKPFGAKIKGTAVPKKKAALPWDGGEEEEESE